MDLSRRLLAGWLARGKRQAAGDAIVVDTLSVDLLRYLLSKLPAPDLASAAQVSRAVLFGTRGRIDRCH